MNKFLSSLVPRFRWHALFFATILSLFTTILIQKVEIYVQSEYQKKRLHTQLRNAQKELIFQKQYVHYILRELNDIFAILQKNNHYKFDKEIINHIPYVKNVTILNKVKENKSIDFRIVFDKKNKTSLYCYFCPPHSNANNKNILNSKHRCYIAIELDTSSLFHGVSTNKKQHIQTLLVNENGQLILINKTRSDAASAIIQSNWNTIKNNIEKGQQGHFKFGTYWYVFSSTIVPITATCAKDNPKKNAASIIKVIAIDTDIKEKPVLTSSLLLKIVILLLFLALLFAFFYWKLAQSSSLLLEKATNSLNGMMLLDHNLKIIDMNPSILAVSGYSKKEIKGKFLKDFYDLIYRKEFYQELQYQIKKRGQWKNEALIRNKDGRVIDVNISIQKIDTQSPSQYIAIFIDISRLKELENTQSNRIGTDPLTRCWNKNFFFDELKNQSLLVAHYTHKYQSCLVLLDVDNFMNIINHRGMPASNDILKKIAAILRKSFRETDIISHIGEDRFSIIIPHTSTFDCNKAISKFRRKMRSTLEQKLTISASIVRITPKCLDEDAFYMAQLALIKAKKQGRDHVVLAKQSSIQQGES